MWTLYLIMAGGFAGLQQIEIGKIGLECHVKPEPDMMKGDFASTEVLLPKWQLSWVTLDTGDRDPYSFFFSVLGCFPILKTCFSPTIVMLCRRVILCDL